MSESSQASVPPALVIMVGPPGTGKSYLVREIARRVQVDVIQSDAIRRRMFARPTYSPEEHAKVFTVAHSRTGDLLRRGRSVVFDATNIYEASRRGLSRIAERAGARTLIVRTVAPDEVVRVRLQGRAAGVDPADRSEAGWEIYLMMKSEFQEISQPHMVVDTTGDMTQSVEEITAFIRG